MEKSFNMNNDEKCCYDGELFMIFVGKRTKKEGLDLEGCIDFSTSTLRERLTFYVGFLFELKKLCKRDPLFKDVLEAFKAGAFDEAAKFYTSKEGGPDNE